MAKRTLHLVLLGIAACSVYDESLMPESDGGDSYHTRSGTTQTGSGGATSSTGSGSTGGSTVTTDASGAAGDNLAGAGGSTSSSVTTGTGGSSGSVGSGSSGTGGTVVAGFDSGATGICSYANPITLLYRTWSRSNSIEFSIKLVNGSTQSIALSSLKFRYYLTNELAAPLVSVLYSDVCCPDQVITSLVKATIQPLSPPVARADTYIEISFSAAGSIAPSDAVDVELEFRTTQTGTSNETNDYSFIASAAGTQSQWTNCPFFGDCTIFHSCLVTAYQNGTLIWGIPPT